MTTPTRIISRVVDAAPRATMITILVLSSFVGHPVELTMPPVLSSTLALVVVAKVVSTSQSHDRGVVVGGGTQVLGQSEHLHESVTASGMHVGGVATSPAG